MEFDEIDVLRNMRSSYTILEDLRNRDNTGLASSEIELFILEKRTFIQMHRTSSNMHFWNMRRGPQPISIKNSDHVMKDAGLNSTSGQIATSSTNRINAISEHCRNTCYLCKLRHFCLQRRSCGLKFEKILSERKILITLNRNDIWINECQQRFGDNFSFIFI